MVFTAAAGCRRVPIVAGRGTTATIALERAGVPFTVHEYSHDPRHESYGLEIELAPADLARAAGATVARIGRAGDRRP
jgi:prolyl-tRNA editing enzyme YbaK/EbsC (Cys-tRNA(Pro) deacylase)